MGGYISFEFGKTYFFILEMQRFAPDALLAGCTFAVFMLFSMPFRRYEIPRVRRTGE
jgi:hypothetical protein